MVDTPREADRDNTKPENMVLALEINALWRNVAQILNEDGISEEEKFAIHGFNQVIGWFLAKVFPDAEDYIAFRMLTGKTVTGQSKRDFDGDLSIVELLKRLQERGFSRLEDALRFVLAECKRVKNLDEEAELMIKIEFLSHFQLRL